MKLPRPVTLAAFVGPLALMFCLGLTPGISFTEDLGRHILLGRIILDSGSVPKTNLLTYTNPDFPCVNHHWLFECGVAVLHSRVGLNGLIFLKAIILCAALGFALAAARKSAARPLGAGIWLSALLSAVILGYRSHLRPELFSFLLVGLFLLCFELIRGSRFAVITRLLTILVMAAWVNTHIYFIFGLGMMGAIALERFFESPSRRRFLVEAAWLAGSVAACCANPNGWSGLAYPFRIMNNYGVTLIENVSPWTLSKIAINPMLIALPILMAMTVLSAVAILLSDRRASGLANLIVAVTALVASLVMARHSPLLALAALPLIARSRFPNIALSQTESVASTPASRAARRARAKAAKSSRPGPAVSQSSSNIPVVAVLRRALAPAALCMNLFLIGAVLNGTYSFAFPPPIAPTPFGLDEPARYERLRKFMSGHAVPGPVLSDFDIGSLVEYNIYPLPAYVDNRPEAFPVSFWQDEYFPAIQHPALMKRLLDMRHVNVAVFSLSLGLIPLSFKPVDNPDWAPVYIDEFFAVWLRRIPENAVTISEHELTRDRIASMTGEISRELQELPSLPWWRRQVRAESILLRLNGIAAAGGDDLVRPCFEQLLRYYPNYRMAREATLEARPE
ncbi:hypothetical protein LLG95_01950 [bacterium]|nr:hypothetical protein [bacterium]